MDKFIAETGNPEVHLPGTFKPESSIFFEMRKRCTGYKIIARFQTMVANYLGSSCTNKSVAKGVRNSYDAEGSSVAAGLGVPKEDDARDWGRATGVGHATMALLTRCGGGSNFR